MAHVLCLGEGCKRWPDAYRGLCGACYMKLGARVRRGETTWGELERRGLALPASPGMLGRDRGKQSVLARARRRAGGS